MFGIQGFSNIFGSTTVQAPPTQGSQVAPPQTQQVEDVEPKVPVPPIDLWKTLWEPTESKEVDGTLPVNMFANFDQGKLLESARKVDFTRSIPPEVLAKIGAGGEDAVKAFAQVINDVAQRSYAQSTFANGKMMEAAMTKLLEGVETRLPSKFKAQQLSQTLIQENPMLAHPAAAVIVEALQAQLLQKFPTASQAELKDHALTYLKDFAGIAGPRPKADPKAKKEEDWSVFMQGV